MAEPRRRHRPLLAIAAIGLLLLGALWGAGSWLRRSALTGAGADRELTFRVTRGPLTISFAEKGSIKAARSEQIFSTLEGMSTIVHVVQEGTSVQKGDLLVELDSSELTQLHNQQAIAVETAQASLTHADEAVEIQESQNESDVKAAELALQLAAIDVKKYKEGDYPLSVSKAKADIHIAEEELKRAENKLNWTRKLAEKGYVTGTELIADSLAVEKARVQSEQARGAQGVLERYTHQKDSKKVDSDFEQAERALKRTQLKALSQLAQAQADQKGKKSTHELSMKRLEKIKDQIQKTKIVAPQDGMVVYHQEGRWGRDDRIIEQGATVRENQHLIDLPDLSVMAVSVQVPEARIHQVQVGLPATITIDAQSELVLRGSVTRIGLLPDYVNRWLNPDLKVYQTDVTIDLYQDLTLLRPGMSARVEILVEELRDALYVPIQSVTTIDGAPVCYVLKGDSFEPRSVEVGLSNDSFIVIRAGLSEGELVQLNAPRPRGAPPSKKEEEPADALGTPDGLPAPAAYQGGEGQPGKRGEGQAGRGGEGQPGKGGEGKRRKGGGKPAPASPPAAVLPPPTAKST